ncbi:hypothetical protein [Hymenobacter sp. APR13]|uniref:hypothetical protein n=1 Tax=Hymenobacter sp. APR13 TaxID=1356852 RepID=UPI0004E04DAE|nr:hypothetical protein [Hymenobacter sp. APR13]AII53834.1 hypothetical protein N008_17855 [Hymenobacter sp. APR13]
MKIPAFSFVLLALLLGAAAPATWDSALNTDPVYGVRRQDLYRQRRVKEVFMDQEGFYSGRLTTERHLNEYQLLDRQGRPVAQERAYNRAIAYRSEWEYNAAGTLVAGTSFSRLGARPDTGRADLAWVPAEHTRYVAEGTEAAGKTRWNVNTGLWEPQTRGRTWVSHDTTYTETRNEKGVRIELERHFSLGKGIIRADYLHFSERGPSEPKYYYYRVEKGRTVESGKVTFEQEIQQYVEKHPEAMRYVLGSQYAFHTLHDYVARRTAGTLEPTTKAVYNRQGQLLMETSYGTRTAYQRDDAGRAITSTVAQELGGGGVVTAYFYRPDGLLAREVVTRPDGTPDENRYYRYRFY